MQPSSPQLDERRREPAEAALDLALSALRRIARREAAEDSAKDLAERALGHIEALLPDRAEKR